MLGLCLSLTLYLRRVNTSSIKAPCYLGDANTEMRSRNYEISSVLKMQNTCNLISLPLFLEIPEI